MVLSNESLFQRDRDQVEYNLKARTALNRYFSSWLDHHQTKKDKWGQLIKYKYLLSRMKVNKLFWAWKLQIRQIKVNKLKSSIVEHTRYKSVLKGCFMEWRHEVANTKQALKSL